MDFKERNVKRKEPLCIKRSCRTGVGVSIGTKVKLHPNIDITTYLAIVCGVESTQRPFIILKHTNCRVRKAWQFPQSCTLWFNISFAMNTNCSLASGKWCYKCLYNLTIPNPRENLHTAELSNIHSKTSYHSVRQHPQAWSEVRQTNMTSDVEQYVIGLNISADAKLQSD